MTQGWSHTKQQALKAQPQQETSKGSNEALLCGLGRYLYGQMGPFSWVALKGYIIDSRTRALRYVASAARIRAGN
eukprot:1183798-Amphidinium_carterae.1